MLFRSTTRGSYTNYWCRSTAPGAHHPLQEVSTQDHLGLSRPPPTCRRMSPELRDCLTTPSGTLCSLGPRKSAIARTRRSRKIKNKNNFNQNVLCVRSLGVGLPPVSRSPRSSNLSDGGVKAALAVSKLYLNDYIVI